MRDHQARKAKITSNVCPLWWRTLSTRLTHPIPMSVACNPAAGRNFPDLHFSGQRGNG
jgi:hypothetical protein